MIIKHTNIFHSKELPNFTQGGIFGLKLHHLATLVCSCPCPLQLKVFWAELSRCQNHEKRKTPILQKILERFLDDRATNQLKENLKITFKETYQGCQMVYFQTKNPNLGKFWRTLEWKKVGIFMNTWNITAIFYNVWPFGIVCGHLVYFSQFGMLVPRKIWQHWNVFKAGGRISASTRELTKNGVTLWFVSNKRAL
jgi:hypothetical protein